MATTGALEDLKNATMPEVSSPVTLQMKFATTTRPDILEAIPGVKRIDGYSVVYDADNMDAAYRLIRLMYKYISW